jgi:peptidoglycan/xylan/chitin deacetylase (PgdA/CDA1 family)
MEVIILLSLIAAGLLWAPAPHLFRLLGERNLINSARQNRTICLTFDDGPSEQLTQQILSLLERYDAHATFYLQGNKLDQREIIELLVSKGHEIGCHGYNHLNAWYSPPGKTWKDMERALRSFEDHGHHCRLVRPPYGKITCFSILQIILRNKRFGWWTLDSNDTLENIETIDSLIDQISKAQGHVVLFHDLDGNRDRSRVKFVLDATQAILEFARKNNYEIKTQGALLGLD